MSRKPSPLGVEIQRPCASDWLPGETIYSLASREQLFMSGRAYPGNSACRGVAHDLPSRLRALMAHSDPNLGTAESATLEHSVLPYYLIFRPTAHRRALVRLAVEGTASSLKARLGLYATRFGAAHPLKACPRCMEDDESRHSVAYWHVAHQFPGVWVCTKHEALLHVAAEKWNGVARFTYRLPRATQLSPSIAGEVSKATFSTLLMLARVTETLVNASGPGPLSLAAARDAYLARLAEHGARGASARSRTMLLANILDSTLREVCLIGWEFAAFAPAMDTRCAQFAPLLTGSRKVKHPLKHVLLAAALFPSAEDFVSRLTASSPPRTARAGVDHPAGNSPRGGKVPASSPGREEFIALLRTHSLSIAAAAEVVHVSHATGQAWAAAAGISTPRRPKVLKSDARSGLIALLRTGAPKPEVVQRYGVSMTTVTRILRTEVGLHDAWKKARDQRARAQARRAWKIAAVRTPRATQQDLRRSLPGVFAWLYRNDREWLQDLATRLANPRRSNNSHIDWEARDRRLSAEVVKAVAMRQTHEVDGVERLTIAQLCAAIPELRRRLSKLGKLPLTAKALRHSIHRGQPSKSRPPIRR